MKALCIGCNNYSTEGNDAFCGEQMWSKANVSKSKIYNALMFECIEYERTISRHLLYPTNFINPIPISS